MLGLLRKKQTKETGTPVQDIVDRTLALLQMLDDSQLTEDELFENVEYVDGWMVIKSTSDPSGFYSVGRGYALKDNATFPLHVHKKSIECLIWVAGEMEIEVNGEKKPLTKDNPVVCIMPGQEHNTVALKEGAMLVYIDVPEEKGL